MVAIAGASVSRFARLVDGQGFRDLARATLFAALDQSGIAAADIDCLVVAGESDVFTLQLNPATLLAQVCGLAPAAAFRVEGGGASGQLAVQAAAARILSGLSRRVAVVGADMTASALPGETIRQLYSHSFDAMTDGPTGITATQVYALSWQAFAATEGLGSADLARVTIAHRSHACANPAAHLPRRHTGDEIDASPMIASPYRRLHCSPLSDGAAALILAAPDALPAHRRTAPRIVGMGSATDRPFARRPEPGAFSAKTRAMQAACHMADLTPARIDLAEVYDAYSGAALQAVHALGLSDAPGRDLADGRFAPDGPLPINLSGGLLGQGAVPGATGVAQVATCAMMLEGRYPGMQPARTPRLALADTHGGICSNAAVTLIAGAA
jgi:acetyl-CoA C-acetyltransferase